MTPLTQKARCSLSLALIFSQVLPIADAMVRPEFEEIECGSKLDGGAIATAQTRPRSTSGSPTGNLTPLNSLSTTQSDRAEFYRHGANPRGGRLPPESRVEEFRRESLCVRGGRGTLLSGGGVATLVDRRRRQCPVACIVTDGHDIKVASF
jgi:hypothetical protein